METFLNYLGKKINEDFDREIRKRMVEVNHRVPRKFKVCTSLQSNNGQIFFGNFYSFISVILFRADSPERYYNRYCKSETKVTSSAFICEETLLVFR